MKTLDRFKTIWQRHFGCVVLVLSCALLVATRAPHLAGPIDNPHSWRQCDTAQYARAFYEDGFDITRPSVCWMGDFKTVVLEFPFPELLMALVYSAFGYHLFLARLVTLAFFSGACVYLFLMVREIAHTRLALFTASVYIALPLAQFYSRAVHIDFFATFFAHAMTYHLIRALRQPRMWETVLAVAMGSLGFLIKAPYAFYFALPLFCVATEKRPIRSVMVLGACLLVAATPFCLWRLHAIAVNASAPDWTFIPGYIKFVNMGNWYFGPLDMRLNPDAWRRLASRFVNDVVSPFGVLLFLLGGTMSIITASKGRWRSHVTIWAWLAGTVMYVIIFLKLNYIHDYYQIPLLGISAVFIAMGVDAPRQLFGRRYPAAASAASMVLLAAISVSCVAYAQRHYFKPDRLREKAGQVLAQTTPPNALVVVAPDIPGTDCRDPRVLFWARRYGWSIYKRHLSRLLIDNLKREGASHLAILARASDDVEEAYGFAVNVYPIGEGDWKVLLADLDGKEPANKSVQATK